MIQGVEMVRIVWKGGEGMCDWLLAGACVVGVARDCSDPRCGGNRVCSTECRKKREMGGCNTLISHTYFVLFVSRLAGCHFVL